MRVLISERSDGPASRPATGSFLGDPESAGYRSFRAGIAEYLALLPPNSHGEPNPADKDPVPRALRQHLQQPRARRLRHQVKYQRTDGFFTRSIVDGEDRARLDQAWNDLFGSWPYHDAYLGMLLDHYGVKHASRKIEDMTAARVAALPDEALRLQVRSLRAHYDAVRQASSARRAGPRDRRSRVRQPRLAAAARTGRAGEPARVLRSRYAASITSTTKRAVRGLLARVLMSPAFLYRVEAAPRAAEAALDDWEMASRMSFFLWSSIPDDELRRAAAAGELRDPGKLAGQVRRMTADPKARRLATEFFGQWLGFYHFDQYRGVERDASPSSPMR